MTDLPNDSSSSSEVRHPPHLTAPLGQQFIVPLGTRRLNILDPGIFSPKSTPEEEEPFSDPWVQKSPFFAQSSTQKSARQPSEVLQPKTYGSSYSTAPRREFEANSTTSPEGENSQSESNVQSIETDLASFEPNFPKRESSKSEEALNSFPTSIQGESILQRSLEVDNRSPNSSESTLQRDTKQDENLAGLSEPAIPSQNVAGFEKHGSDSPSSTIQRSVEIGAGTTSLGEPAIPSQNVVDFSDREPDSPTSTAQGNSQPNTTAVQANELPQSQEASFVQRKSEASRHESDSLSRTIQRSAEIDINVTKFDSSATKFSELTSRSQNAAEFGDPESGFSSRATQGNPQLGTTSVQANEIPESQEANFIQRQAEASRHESDSLNHTIQKSTEIDASAAKFSELTSRSQNAAEFGDRRSDSSSSTIQRSTEIGKETTQLNDSFNDSAILSQNAAKFANPESGFSSRADQDNTQPDTTSVQAGEIPKSQEANFIQRQAEASRHESNSLNNTIQKSAGIDASAAKFSELTSLSQNATEFANPESGFSSSATQGNPQLDTTPVQAGETPESQEANFIQRKAEISDRASSPLDSRFQNNRPFNDSSSRSNDSTPQHQGFNLIQKQLDSSDYLSDPSNTTIQNNPQIDERITQPIESTSQSQEPSLIQKQLDSSDHLSSSPNNTIQSNPQIDERITQAIESASQPQAFNFAQKRLDSSNHPSDSSNSKIQGNESIVNPIESASQSQEPNIESASQSQEPSLIQKQLDSSDHLSDSPSNNIPEPGVTAERLQSTDNHQQCAQFTDHTTVQRLPSEQPTQLTNDTHLSERVDSTKLERGENDLNIQQISADDSALQRQVAEIQYEDAQNSEFLKNSEFSSTEEAELQSSFEASSIQRQTELSANFQPQQASQPAASDLRTESLDLRSQFFQGNEPLQAQHSSSELEAIQNQTKSVRISELASNAQSIAHKPDIDESLTPKDEYQSFQAQSSPVIQNQTEHLEDLSSSQSMRSDSKSAPSKPIHNEAEYSLQPSTDILAIQRQADPSNSAQSEHNNQPTTREFDASTSEFTQSKESVNVSSQSPMMQRQADSSDNLNAQSMNDEIHPDSSASRSPANHDAVAHSPQSSLDIPTLQRQPSLPETIQPNFHSSLSQNPNERSINPPQFSSESSTLQRAIDSEDSQSIEHEIRSDSSDSRSRSEFDQGQNTFISQPSLPTSEATSQQSTNDLVAQRKQTGSELPPILEESQETKPSGIENLGDTSTIQRSEESDQPNVSHSSSNISNPQSTAEANLIGNSFHQKLESAENPQSTIELKSVFETSAIQRQIEPLENPQRAHNSQNLSNDPDINSSVSQQQSSNHIEIPFNTQAPSESLNIQRQSTPEIESGSHSVNAQLRSELPQNQETAHSRSLSEFPKIQRHLDSAHNLQSEQESQQYDSLKLTAGSSEVENSESSASSFNSAIVSEPENLIHSETSNQAPSDLLQPSLTIAHQAISRAGDQAGDSSNSAIDHHPNSSQFTNETLQKLESFSGQATQGESESMFESSHLSSSTAAEVEFEAIQPKPSEARNSQLDSNLQSVSAEFLSSTSNSILEQESSASEKPSSQILSESSQSIIQQKSDVSTHLAPNTDSPQLANVAPISDASESKLELSKNLGTELQQSTHPEHSSSIQRAMNSDSDTAQTPSESSQSIIQQKSDVSTHLAPSNTHLSQLADAELFSDSSRNKFEPSRDLDTESNQPAHSEHSSSIQRAMNSDNDMSEANSQVSENLSDRQISTLSSSAQTNLKRSSDPESSSQKSASSKIVTPESFAEFPSDSIQKKSASSSENLITSAQNRFGSAKPPENSIPLAQTNFDTSTFTIPSEPVTSSENTQPERISRSLNSSLPVIPTVLQELSVLRSLNPTPNLQPKQDAYPQHTSKSSQTIDSSWSSLDDLVQSIAENPKPIERSLPRIQRTAEISQPQPTIQKKEPDYLELSTSESETEVIDYLDHLAQEVYLLLRQRLEIERERRGSNYSSRL